jgi:hypothetical protein
MEDNKKIYIDLDSLLDTRFSMLYNLDKDMLNKIYVNKEYDNRIINEFDYIPSNIFNLLYKYRGNDLLSISYFTKILKIVMLEVGMLKNNLQIMNLNQPITIDINVHPYTIDKHIEDVKVKLLSMLNIDGLNINIIDVNPISLTPDKVNNEYISLIMYDGMKWFGHMLNTEAFKNNYIPTINLILPALLDKPVVMKKIEDYESMFNDIVKQGNMFINMKFTPVEYFNILM